MALAVLETLPDSTPQKRGLQISCLTEMTRTDSTIGKLSELLDPPQSPAESIQLLGILEELGEAERLSQVLSYPMIHDSSDPALAEYRERLRARIDQ